MKRTNLIGNIYKHYKGSYYKVVDVAFHHDGKDVIIIYHKCDENGIFQSVRIQKPIDSVNGTFLEYIVEQPFYRDSKEFLGKVFIGTSMEKERFSFVKKKNYENN